MASTDVETGLPGQPEDELVQTELEGAQKKKKSRKGRIIAIVVSVVVVGGVFAFALPKIADYGAVWDEIQQISWPWIVALVFSVLLNTATYGPPWMAALPGLSYWNATRMSLASTAMSAVAPGGAAVGMASSVAMLRAWGFRGRPVGLAVVVTGVWNQLVILGLPIIALAGVAAQGGSNRTLELVAVIALIVFIVIVVGFAVGLSSERLARRIGDRAIRLASWAKGLIGKAPVKWKGESFVHFREESIGLIRRRWWQLTLATLAGHLTVFVVLLASVRAVGIPHTHVTIVEAFAAWTLVAFGATNDEAVAATLIYRFLTIVPTLVFGLISAATWKVGRRPRQELAEPA
jgi:uncharacterized membrane protein YbhN (UPF0104 family)